MADMKRLLEDGGTPFERALLGAAAREIPAPMLERRMRRALGIGFIASGAKLAMALVPVAAIALGAAAVGIRHSRSQAQEVAFVAPKPVPRQAERPVSMIPPAVPLAADAHATPMAKPPKQQVPSAALPGRRATATTDLKREIRLLDQARSAVQNGASALALELLRSYDQRYPRGAFRQEVAVLRVEALERRGERERANDLARKFVAENPDSPHVERVERVTKSE